MNSTNRNVVLSSLGHLTFQVIRAGQQLLWVPLFLAALGPEGYGEWLTLFGLAGYAVMADLGVQTYWLNLLTRAHVRGDNDNYKRIFRAGLFLFLVLGGLTLPVAAAFSLAEGPSRALNLKLIEPATASMVFLVLVASALLSVASRMMRGVFRTVGKNPTSVWFEVNREALTVALVAAAILVGLGPLGLAWVYAGIAIMMLAWSVLTVRGRFAELLDLRLHKADRTTVRSLVGGGSVHLASVLSNLLLVQGTLIITHWALGAAAVALVASSRTLANLVRQMAGSVCYATLPEFSRLEAAGDTVGMGALLRRGVSLVMLFSGMAGIGLIGLGPRLFEIWTGGRFENAAPLIYLFAASVVVDAARLPLHDFLLGCNRIALVAVTNIVYAVLSLLLTWLLFPSLGAWSVPVATTVCGAAVHLPVMALGSSRILGGAFVGRLLARMGLGASLAGLCAAPLALSALSGDHLARLVPQVLFSLTAFGMLFWLVLLDRGDARVLKRKVHRWFLRTSP